MEEVIICFSNENRLWTKEEYSLALMKMPETIVDKIMAYNDLSMQQLKLQGKLQLLSLMENFDNSLELVDLCFTDSNRPYFHSEFDFNIAHSGDIVICGGLKNGRIGIDIEKIKPLDIQLFEFYFSSKEWNIISGSEDRLLAFYRLWTRKEALSKALGKGVLEDFSKLEVINDCIETEAGRFFLHELMICPGYCANMAVSFKEVCWTIKDFNSK